MHFRAQKKSAQDVSLSDYIDTGTDGAPLALMDVVSDEEDLLERVSTREDLRKLCKAVDAVLTEQEIADYVATGEPMDKAGSYGIQGLGSLLVEKIDGDFFNVMGLPLLRLSRMLANFGVKLL